jgi:hypothetical protein
MLCYADDGIRFPLRQWMVLCHNHSFDASNTTTETVTAIASFERVTATLKLLAMMLPILEAVCLAQC